MRIWEIFLKYGKWGPRFRETHSWASFRVVKIHNNLYVNGLLAMVLNTETTNPFLFGGKMCTCWFFLYVKFVKFYCPKNNTSLKHWRNISMVLLSLNWFFLIKMLLFLGWYLNPKVSFPSLKYPQNSEMNFYYYFILWKYEGEMLKIIRIIMIGYIHSKYFHYSCDNIIIDHGKFNNFKFLIINNYNILHSLISNF